MKVWAGATGAGGRGTLLISKYIQVFSEELTEYISGIRQKREERAEFYNIFARLRETEAQKIWTAVGMKVNF